MAFLKQIIAFIRKDSLRSLLLILVIFQYSNFYRVAVRCMYEGSVFEWMDTWGVSLLGEERAMRIMGNGLEGHFLIIMLIAILFITVIFGITRRSNDLFSKWIALGFTGVLAIREVMLSIAYGDQYQIVGETFRLRLDYSILGPTLSLMIFILVIVWAFQENKEHETQSDNLKIYGLVAFLVIPAIFLMRTGEQHNWTDILGINIIYAQLALLVLNWMGVFHQGSEFSKTPVSH